MNAVVESQETKPAQMMPWKAAMVSAKDRFIEIASTQQIVDWKRESMFALQAIEKSDYMTKIANENPASLRNAIINVAAIGITLNPAAQYAALVPRDGSVCLDIMYRGLLKIATDAGSIRWAQAELVYAADKFSYHGPTRAPDHAADPFSKQRGGVVGVYCVAKTVDGDLLCEVMSIDEVNAIRDRSSAWKAWVSKKKSCPWVTDPGEMAKKTVIKRARKTWPESRDVGQAQRLHHATELANAADGFEQEHDEINTTITPTGGAWDAESEESQAFLMKLATKMKGYIAAGQIDDACAVEDENKLSMEERIALWTRFDSKERSAIKKHRESLKEQKDGV